MQRIALLIEYDGSHYCGWQRQRSKPSIQSTLEEALAKVAAHDIKVTCAGRTDAKVHAVGQVVHFDTHAIRTMDAWVRGANTYLPRDIRVKWSSEVPLDFDARKSALSRHYAYVIQNERTSPSVLRHGMTWVYQTLDVQRMKDAALHLLGEHDFSAFRAAGCQSKSPIRRVLKVDFRTSNQKIIFEIQANAFLHHMVRNIMGSLLLIGQHRHESDWLKTVLQSKDRRQAGAMAPPQGLYLLNVIYPTNFSLPVKTSEPWFL